MQPVVHPRATELSVAPQPNQLSKALINFVGSTSRFHDPELLDLRFIKIVEAGQHPIHQPEPAVEAVGAAPLGRLK
jgi:hypothetical protein